MSLALLERKVVEQEWKLHSAESGYEGEFNMGRVQANCDSSGLAPALLVEIHSKSRRHGFFRISSLEPTPGICSLSYHIGWRQ